MKKVTYTLDDETVADLERIADRLSRPKSQVVREAIQLYREEMDRLTDEEREAMLRAFDRLTAKIPKRSRAEVERELDEIRRARRSAGGRTTKKASR